jgi:hypothetical protein
VIITRFCAMIRKPDFSIMALIAPVRLRAVASGLRIEKVRSIAIKISFEKCGRPEARLIAAVYAWGKRRARFQGGRRGFG